MGELDVLFWKLQNKVYKGTDNTYELINGFLKDEGKKISEYMTSLFEKDLIQKCNHKSDQIRKQGNEFYVKRQCLESLRYYTRALSMAEKGSESYVTALANRSAATYSIQEYEYSLRDIIRCLSYNCPENLKAKVYVRKIQCYVKMGDVKNADNCLIEAFNFIEGNTSFTDVDKEMYKNKLSQMKVILHKTQDVPRKYECNMPNIIKNDHFPGASSSLALRYSSEKGRHVVAEEDIRRGDVLFVEQAYVFAPIFNENYELSHDKCCYCLQTNKALVPCKFCCVCLYCDDICEEKAWRATHEWECKGMQVNLWSTVGLGFPAFRIFLKNLSLGSIELLKEQNNISLTEDSSVLSRQLVTNLVAQDNALEFLILTAIIIYYLESQTHFFDWLIDKILIENSRDLKTFFGSILLKHIAQIASNASVIEHWKVPNYKYVPMDKVPVATGLYPAVSMMNHSCKTNVSMFYVNDIVVVKALEDIKKYDEVLNCYGVDYRYTNKEERQRALKMLYHFECLCKICENEQLEIDYLNGYRCYYCSDTIMFEDTKCPKCAKSIDISNRLSMEEEAKQLLEKKILCLEDIEKAHKIMKHIYNKQHINLSHCYDRYKTYFLGTSQYNEALKSFVSSLEIKERHWGRYSLKVAKEILTFLERLKESRADDSKMALQRRNIEVLYGYLKQIIPLYYPDDYILYNELEALHSVHK